MDVTTTDELAALTRSRIQVGQSTSFSVSFLERAIERLHDIELTKFSNDFFSVLPASYFLLSNTGNLHSQKAEFLRRLDDYKEYYESKKYTVAWQNATHT